MTTTLRPWLHTTPAADVATQDGMRERADAICLVSLLIDAMAIMLPWWAVFRRARLRAVAADLIALAGELKKDIEEASP